MQGQIAVFAELSFWEELLLVAIGGIIAAGGAGVAVLRGLATAEHRRDTRIAILNHLKVDPDEILKQGRNFQTNQVFLRHDNGHASNETRSSLTTLVGGSYNRISAALRESEVLTAYDAWVVGRKRNSLAKHLKHREIELDSRDGREKALRPIIDGEFRVVSTLTGPAPPSEPADPVLRREVHIVLDAEGVCEVLLAELSLARHFQRTLRVPNPLLRTWGYARSSAEQRNLRKKILGS